MGGGGLIAGQKIPINGRRAYTRRVVHIYWDNNIVHTQIINLAIQLHWDKINSKYLLDLCM